MGSRDQPQGGNNLSSLIVRPADSGGSDYEPGEVRPGHDPYYSRSERFHETPGYDMRAGSGSPLRQRKNEHRYGSDFDHPGGPRRGRGFRGGRGPGRFRDFSPPYGRGRGGRSFGRGFDGPVIEDEPFRGDGMSRNNPNVPPREGDWICSEPSCGNLNFARRSYCNNCNKLRAGPIGGGSGSPRRNYPGPAPPHGPPPRFSGPPLERGPGRDMNGYGSPPPPPPPPTQRGWGGREGPREFGMGPPNPRHGPRFPDHHMRRDDRGRPDYREDDYRRRGKFDRPIPPPEWANEMGHGDRERDEFFHERRGYDPRDDRRPPSSRLPPNRGQWVRDPRERSRSPMRVPPKDYPRDTYMERGRVDRRGMGRERLDEPY